MVSSPARVEVFERLPGHGSAPRDHAGGSLLRSSSAGAGAALDGPESHRCACWTVVPAPFAHSRRPRTKAYSRDLGGSSHPQSPPRSRSFMRSTRIASSAARTTSSSTMPAARNSSNSSSPMVWASAPRRRGPRIRLERSRTSEDGAAPTPFGRRMEGNGPDGL